MESILDGSECKFMQEFKRERTFISKLFAVGAHDIACAQTGLKPRTRSAPFHNKRVAIRGTAIAER